LKSIDFIVPVYQNQGSIIPTYMQIKKSFSNLNYDFNVIFINDGSTDYSKNEIISLVNKNKKVKLIDLAKNYGQVNAIIAGFTFSSADLVITISADLQDPINEIVNYLKNMHKQSKKVVVFARKTRNDGYFKNLISSIVWKIIKYVTKLNFPKGGFDTFLMAREIKDKLILYADKDNFLQGLL
jgi:glycosyltransferase involved in cell wall biosynthesis